MVHMRFIVLHYDVIMSFTVVVVTFGPFKLSLMSRRKTDKFWVNLKMRTRNRILIKNIGKI